MYSKYMFFIRLVPLWPTTLRLRELQPMQPLKLLPVLQRLQPKLPAWLPKQMTL